MSIYAQAHLLCLNPAFLQLLGSRTMPDHGLIEKMIAARASWWHARSLYRYLTKPVTVEKTEEAWEKFGQYIVLLERLISEGYNATSLESADISKWESQAALSTHERHKLFTAHRPGFSVKFDSDDEEHAPLPRQGGAAVDSISQSSTEGEEDEEDEETERKRPRDDSSADEDGWHTVKR